MSIQKEAINALFEELLEKSDVDDEVSLDHNEEDSVQNTSESTNFINQITPTDIANLSSHFKGCADMLKFGLEQPRAPENFIGICLDTGTTRSMIGWNQFLALSIRMNFTPTLHPVDSVVPPFG